MVWAIGFFVLGALTGQVLRLRPLLGISLLIIMGAVYFALIYLVFDPPRQTVGTWWMIGLFVGSGQVIITRMLKGRTNSSLPEEPNNPR